MRLVLSVALVAAALTAACDGDPAAGPLFPDDYAATYQEVRDCRRSGGAHDVNHIRVVADPAAVGPYRDRDRPFPVGAVVLKEEYDFSDEDCSGAIVQWSVMVKLADGDAPELLDWSWQRVSNLGDVLEEDAPRCVGCHEGCGVPPDGYDGTCAVP
jgi:hypothetical protein